MQGTFYSFGNFLRKEYRSKADAEIDAEAGGDAEGDSDVVASTSTATTSAPTESTVQVPPTSSLDTDPRPSTSESSLEPPAKRVRLRPKQVYQDKVADIALATSFLPVSADSLHNTGIPAQYVVKRAGASSQGTSLSACPYTQDCSDPPYMGDLPSCGSHVRKVHLGVCVSCPYCSDQWYYNANGWKKQMRSTHSAVPWYSSQLQVLPPTVMPPPPPALKVVVSSAPKSEPPLASEVQDELSLGDIQLPFSLPAPLPTELLEESIPYVAAPEDDEGTEDLTPEQEEQLLQSGDGPSDLPGDEEWDIKEAEIDLNKAWDEMRAARPELSFQQMKEYVRWQFAPSDLRQFDYAANRSGTLMSRRRKDDSATVNAAQQLMAASVKEPEPLPPLEPGEQPVLKRHAPQQVKVWPRELTGLIWRARKDGDDNEGPTPMS